MITKWLEFNIVCDACGLDGCNTHLWYWYKQQDQYWQENMEFSTKGKRDMRKIARRYGWKLINGMDYCPKCCLKLNK